MKQAVNFTLGGSLGVLLLAGILSCGCSRSPEAKAARYLQSGKKFLAKKDYRRAVLELSNAVQATPKNSEIYYQLGLAYLATGDLNPAVANFRKALELNPKHVRAQLAMAQLLASSGDKAFLQDAERRLKSLLADAPADPSTLNTLAFTELQLGKPEDAAGFLEQALKQSPQPMTSAVLMAKAKLAQQDFAGAGEVLRNACQAHPNSANCHVILGGFCNRVNKPAEAIQEFQKALALDPGNAPALLYLAITQYALGQKPAAEQNFRQLSTSHLKTYRLLYGVFLFREQRREEAVREFERVFHQDPADRLARTQLVSAYRAVGRAGDADRILNDALRKNSKDVDALLQRGALAVEAGRYTEAQEAINQILHLRPYSAEAHYILSRIHQSQGALLSRRQELFEAIRLNPYLLPVRLELAGLLTGTNAAKTALEVLEEAPDLQKKEMSFLVQKNWALITLGNSGPELRKSVEAALTSERSEDLLVQASLLRLQDRDTAGAQAAAEEALSKRPDDVRAMEILVQVFKVKKQLAAGVERVKQYAARQHQSAIVQQFLGQLLLATGDRTQARTAFSAAKAANPGSADVDLIMAQMDITDGKLESARQTLNRLTSNPGPAGATAHLWLGNLDEMGGNHSAAANHFRHVLEVDGTNIQALNNLAFLLVEYANQPDEALKYAEKAEQLAPESAAVANTLGWVLYRKGLYSLAVKHLEEAVNKEDSPRRRYHLAMAYAKLGAGQRAQATLEAALKMDHNLPEAAVARQVVREAR